MDYIMPGLPVHHQLLELTELMSIQLVMPSNHLIFCHPLLSPSIFPSIRVFSNESVLRIWWPKYWSFRNTVLVFAIYQHELAIGIHMSPPSWMPLPPPTLSHPSKCYRAPVWVKSIFTQSAGQIRDAHGCLSGLGGWPWTNFPNFCPLSFLWKSDCCCLVSVCMYAFFFFFFLGKYWFFLLAHWTPKKNSPFHKRPFVRE